MNELKIYLDNKLVEDENTLRELIKIDNYVCHHHIDYNKLIQECNLKKLEQFNGIYNFITDGEINTVYNMLINYSLNIKNVHIMRNNVGINSWFVQRINDYYQNNGINSNINLDISKTYENYENDETPLIIMGNIDFIEGIKDLFENKSIYTIEI